MSGSWKICDGDLLFGTLPSGIRRRRRSLSPCLSYLGVGCYFEICLRGISPELRVKEMIAVPI